MDKRMKIILIFAILIAFGCSEEHETKKKICSPFRMTISDAIPVQFWVNGVETYNQKEVCGINSVCFCQQFNCDDEIRLQFEDTGTDATLIIYDSLGAELTSLTFTEISPDVYELSFVPSELNICDEQIRLKIQSTNLSSWTIRTSAANNSWRSVTYGNGLFVAVSSSGTGNRVMTSPDGITWTTRTSAADKSWQSVTFGNGLFVAVSVTGGAGEQVMTSPDGITWTSRVAAAADEWISVTFGNNLFVAVSNNAGSFPNQVMTSSDGITWTLRTVPAGNVYRSVTFGNGLFVAVSTSVSDDRVMTSPDGITWTTRTGTTNESWSAIAYGNGLFVVVSNAISGNDVMTSPNGITWTLRTLPAAAAANSWQAVTYGGGLFVAVADTGTGNRVMDSPDGITWTIRTSAADNEWSGVAYNNGFVAVSDTGTGNRVMSNTIDDLAFSDCIDIKTSHDCTALIRYDNAKDFAGIEYSDFSPTAEFYLRIPAVFFHERNIEEEENFELSSENMVRLRNEIKVKRLLEVGFMPDYMHRKLLLILAHDTVEIDGEEWIKRDPYEKEEPGNKRYPLKKASVLLTQKDYIKRNIL